ncbi:sugar phosphate isomerase/epimerase [bacterium]|nr:sugar phosphate isomerase/epimerase [bacterium]
MKKPVVKKPVVKKPVVKKPVVKKAAVNKPVVKKPVVKKAAVKKAVANKAVVKKPVVKKLIAVVRTVEVRKQVHAAGPAPSAEALKLAAFADEIGPEIDVQIENCVKNGVKYIELRGVSGKNVLDLDVPLRKEIKMKLADSGMGIAAIGSPIGKVRIDEPFDPHFERFKTAVELAEYFDAPLIRVFSYYPPEGVSNDDLVARHRDEVFRRMQAKIDYMQGRRPVLVHENEHAIFGESASACLLLLRTLQSPKLRAAFDPANFVVDAHDPLEAWQLLKPYTVHFHIKDALLNPAPGQHKIVPAGEGDGHIPEILRDAYESGYRGFLTLEPHLQKAGQFVGFTGPELFKAAVDALKNVAAQIGVPL